ncbi:DUF982 domain-containing protein [Mycoplana sp. MJR14]|uniref:DUF982 domain-containing protein n=1 Tax=Mycoplana sp. MJR14 TaxID=3032583 RepID=UPI0023D9A75D|nr:DUF982 domain-containing protein [Mycoplana sp. MJR14]MDF1635701.1 DUF982 domain-containing protein [Mycoplana sp. MJR14]
MHIPDVPWSVAVSVQLQNGNEHIFHGPYDALDFLENEWPTRHGQKYLRAVRSCRGSLNKMTPLAIAREDFIAACLEAGLQAKAMPPVFAAKTTGAHSLR